MTNHSARMDLEKHARKIQKLFSDPNVTPANKFMTLTEHKALVVLTCNSIGKEVQATFHHHQLKESFGTTKPEPIGVMGFGQTANAVRIDPATFFATAKKDTAVPSIEEFLAVTNDTEFKMLSAESSSQKMTRNRFVVLQPWLVDVLVDLKHFDAAYLGVKFIEKIRELHKDDLKGETEKEKEKQQEENQDQVEEVQGKP